MKKVFITGITGFAGSHLAELLVSLKKYEVCGTYLLPQSLRNIEGIKDKVRVLKIDLNRENEISTLIKDFEPDLVFHLAALTAPADSFASPQKVVTENLTLEINLLEAIKRNRLVNTRVLIVSSAEIYGLVKKEDLPIDEETPFMPTNPYAVSKLAQDFLGLQYFLSYNLKIIRVRPFNHIGPRQSPDFVVGAWASQIAQIEKGEKEPLLLVGNLKARRDFTDVRDMVKAYVLAIEEGKIGEVYNIGSGISYEISGILDILLSKTSSKIKVKKDASLFRPSDNPNLVCDFGKFRSLVKWKPVIPIDKTLQDTLDYWRNLV